MRGGNAQQHAAASITAPAPAATGLLDRRPPRRNGRASDGDKLRRLRARAAFGPLGIDLALVVAPKTL